MSFKAIVVDYVTRLKDNQRHQIDRNESENGNVIILRICCNCYGVILRIKIIEATAFSKN